MDNITLGQIALLLAEIAGVIVSIGTIVGVVIKLSGWIKKNRREKEINPILEEIKKIDQCKDAIIDFISDVKSGKNVSSKEERAYEAYDKYTNVYHQNSYIHKLWEENVNTTKE